MKLNFLLMAFFALVTHPALAAQYIYSGQVQIEVQGLEFRASKAYPKDTQGDGYINNARENLKEYCTQLDAELSKNMGSAYVSSNCFSRKNVAQKKYRRQYQALLNIETTVEALTVLPGSKIDGALIRIKDFQNEPLKWQTSRTAARDSYEKACEAFKAQALLDHGPNLILADCGLTKEDAGKVGWHYFSKGQIIVNVDINTIPACPNGKRQDQVWWDIIPDDYVVSVNCTFGGNKKEIYDRKIQRYCDGQNVTDTGTVVRGAYKRSTGACNLPANCSNGQLHGNSWVEIDPTPIREDVSCKFGGNKRNLYQREHHYSCYNGSINYNGSQRGSFIESRGHCKAPANCGQHPHNSQWWKQTGRERVPQHCPYGGNKVDVYKQLTLMSCYNGHTQTSHRTKRGAFIRTKGKCKPAPKNCGPHAHGSVWWKPTGQVSKAVNCPHGGNKKKVFQKLTQMRCQNGSKINTQKTKRGNLIKTVGKCKSAPKNCGPHAHGSAWWKRTGKERVVHACPHGGKKVEVYEKLTQKRCKNGNVSNGATKRGSLIRVNNKCKAPKPPKKNKKGRKKKKS